MLVSTLAEIQIRKIAVTSVLMGKGEKKKGQSTVLIQVVLLMNVCRSF